MPQKLTTSPTELTYVVKFSEVFHHVIEVEIWICRPTAASSPMSASDSLEIVFPVWTPGSYMVREYTRNIESIAAAAYDSVKGTKLTRLPLRRHGKNRWLVKAAAD